MPLSGVGAVTEYAADPRHRATDRRAPQEGQKSAEFEAVASAPSPSVSENRGFDPAADAAFYASRFKANLSQLDIAAEPRIDATQDDARADEADRSLFEFFGNLGVLLVAVRAGDLKRARSAAAALEMEVLVAHNSALSLGDSALAHGLDDLGRLLGAAQSGDETSARAAAKELAHDIRSAVARTIADGRPAGAPPDPYSASPDARDAGAAYDTLATYLDGDAPPV